MNTNIIQLILLVIALLVIYNYCKLEENFTENNIINNVALNNIANTNDTIDLPIIKILEYYTEDGGISLHWQRPTEVLDYMAIIKNEDGGEEVKIYFKDTLSSECDDSRCKYSFQNLENNVKYSIVIAGVRDRGIGKFSSKIMFTPTFQRMHCNANGTCNVVKTDIEPTLDAKIGTIMSNDGITKEVLAKCQGMLDRDEAVYDINQIYEADGQFKEVKDKLKFPEHLLLPIKKGPTSLEELVKHQLEMGIINLNVHTEGMI
jgi:hypothetical protein